MPKPHRFVHKVFAAIAIALLCTAASEAARGRRASIDQAGGSWGGETPCDDLNTPSLEDCPVLALPGDMVIKIGSREFTHFRIDRNGFLSLGENANFVPATFTTGAQQLRAVSGDLIAPFYAPIQIRTAESDNGFCPYQCVWDLTYATSNVRNDDDPTKDAIGLRATWGLFPRDPRDPLGPEDYPENARNRGVSMNGAAASADRNIFQIWLIDREPVTHHSGDFDIQFNYSGVLWESSPTLIGVKTGPAGAPEVLLDFAKFYSSFLDDNPSIAPARAAACAQGSDSLLSSEPYFASSIAFFDRTWALACNTIVVEFRDGVPNLRGYTADLTVSLSTDVGATPAHSATPHPMSLTLTNAGPSAATSLTANVTLPAGATLVSSPASACSQTATVAVCSVSAIEPSTSTTIPVAITTSQNGDNQRFDVTADADQFDPDLLGNSTTALVSFASSADVSIIGCVRPSTVLVGATANVKCTVKNDGPQSAGNVNLTIAVPSNIVFSSGANCAIGGATLTCSTANLASGATIEFSATFNAISAGAAAISASVQSDTFNPGGSNVADGSFMIENKPVEKKKEGGGQISLELLLALLICVGLAAKRRMAY